MVFKENLIFKLIIISGVNMWKNIYDIQKEKFSTRLCT